MGTFADNSTRDISREVVLPTSNPVVAVGSASTAGDPEVLGRVAGTATITAIVGTLSSSMLWTVTR